MRKTAAQRNAETAREREIIRRYLERRPDTYDRMEEKYRVVLERVVPRNGHKPMSMEVIADRWGIGIGGVAGAQSVALRMVLRWAAEDAMTCPTCHGTGYVSGQSES